MDDLRRMAVFACVVLLIPIVIWRCGYMMLSAKRGKMNSKRFRDHIVYLFPVWHGSNTPYGKGLDYLPQLRQEILQVLAKYEKIDLDQVTVQLEKDGDCDVLELSVVLSDAPAASPALMPSF